jgi:predicted CoA-binding protein
VSAGPREILERARTVAVVGASRHPWKAAHSVPAALQACGFRIIPVNPGADELFGERVFPRLADVDVGIDVVDVFRPAAECPAVVEQAIAVAAGAVWLQLGIRSAQARALAAEAGLDYVEDLCIGVEVQRYGIHKAP